MGESPLSQLRRLRAALRHLRDDRGFTQREVAEELDWSISKLIRIEKGPVGISVTDVRALLQHYGVTDPQRVAELVELARASKRPAWWHQYREYFPAQTLTFLGLEAGSIRVRQFQILVFPGLLQHPDYVRALVGGTTSDPETLQRAVDVRTTRQQLLTEDGPTFFFVIDESVLRRMVGSPEVMRSQLEHVLEVGALPNVTVQVVPYSVGVHQGMKGSFEIFELSESQDDYALLLEQPYVDRLIEEMSEETREYISIFRELEKIAASPAESATMIERAIDSFGGKS